MVFGGLRLGTKKGKKVRLMASKRKRKEHPGEMGGVMCKFVKAFTFKLSVRRRENSPRRMRKRRGGRRGKLV